MKHDVRLTPLGRNFGTAGWVTMSEASLSAWEKENVEGMTGPKPDLAVKPVGSVCFTLHRGFLPLPLLHSLDLPHVLQAPLVPRLPSPTPLGINRRATVAATEHGLKRMPFAAFCRP